MNQQYHKKAADELAVSLEHFDIYENRLLYPEQPRLDLVHNNGQAITSRELLQERSPGHELEALQKIHLAAHHPGGITQIMLVIEVLGEESKTLSH